MPFLVQVATPAFDVAGLSSTHCAEREEDRRGKTEHSVACASAAAVILWVREQQGWGDEIGNLSVPVPLLVVGKILNCI